MTNEQLQSLTNQLCQKCFHVPFKHPATFKKLGRNLFGQFIGNKKSHRCSIQINSRMIDWFNYDIMVKVIKHELTHYWLWKSGKRFGHTKRFWSIAYAIKAEPWSCASPKYKYYQLFYAHRTVYCYIDILFDNIHYLKTRRHALNCTKGYNLNDFMRHYGEHRTYVYLGALNFTNEPKVTKIIRHVTAKHNKYLNMNWHGYPFSFEHPYKWMQMGNLIRTEAEHQHISMAFHPAKYQLIPQLKKFAHGVKTGRIKLSPTLHSSKS